jgi:hypothetical protein
MNQMMNVFLDVFKAFLVVIKSNLDPSLLVLLPFAFS